LEISRGCTEPKYLVERRVLSCIGGDGELPGPQHGPDVCLCLLWVVAFDHRQVDAGFVADSPGRAE
jgi:hypothetical protein